MKSNYINHNVHITKSTKKKVIAIKRKKNIPTWEYQ